jgi:hypothetical protein
MPELRWPFKPAWDAKFDYAGRQLPVILLRYG